MPPSVVSVTVPLLAPMAALVIVTVSTSGSAPAATVITSPAVAAVKPSGALISEIVNVPVPLLLIL